MPISAAQGSVEAARMAVEEFGGSIDGAPIEVHRRPTTRTSPISARTSSAQWIDVEDVDVIVDVPTSSVALAGQEIVKEKNRIFLMSGAASTELTGEACSPNTIHWTYDTYALAVGTGRAMVQEGGDSWFFITADYAFGHQLEAGHRDRREGGGRRGAGRGAPSAQHRPTSRPTCCRRRARAPR